jgi:hypothetical protein
MTFQEKVGTGTCYQSCRRLSDNWNTECVSYDTSKSESFTHVFNESSKEAAAKLLYSNPSSEETEILGWYRTENSIIFPIRIPVSKGDMLQVSTSAKLGNLFKLVPFIREIGVSCTGVELPNLPDFRIINLVQYRINLGNLSLNKKDLYLKTGLQFVINAKNANKLTSCGLLLRF